MPRHLPRPLSDPAAVERMLKKTRSSKATIGDLCLWSAREIEISPKALSDLLAKLHLEKDWAPVPIRPKTVVRKALTKIRPRLENGDLKVLVRKIVENQEQIRYGIVSEERDLATFDLDYGMLNQVIFHKDTGDLEFTKAEVPEIVDEYEYLKGMYTQREVLRMTQNIILGHGAIPMRDGSGMYFLPSGMKEITDSLRDLYNRELDGTFGHAHFRALPLYNTGAAREEMGYSVKPDLLLDLEEAEKAIRSLEEYETPNALQTNAAIQRFNSAQSKVQMYSQLLQMDVEDMQGRLDAVRKTVESLVVSIL